MKYSAWFWKGGLLGMMMLGGIATQALAQMYAPHATEGTYQGICRMWLESMSELHLLNKVV